MCSITADTVTQGWRSGIEWEASCGFSSTRGSWPLFRTSLSTGWNMRPRLSAADNNFRADRDQTVISATVNSRHVLHVSVRCSPRLTPPVLVGSHHRCATMFEVGGKRIQPSVEELSTPRHEVCQRASHLSGNCAEFSKWTAQQSEIATRATTAVNFVATNALPQTGMTARDGRRNVCGRLAVLSNFGHVSFLLHISNTCSSHSLYTAASFS